MKFHCTVVPKSKIVQDLEENLPDTPIPNVVRHMAPEANAIAITARWASDETKMFKELDEGEMHDARGRPLLKIDLSPRTVAEFKLAELAHVQDGAPCRTVFYKAEPDIVKQLAALGMVTPKVADPMLLSILDQKVAPIPTIGKPVGGHW